MTGTWLATPVAFYLVEDKTFSAGRILWKDLAGVRVARRRIVSVFLEITMTDGTQMRLGTSRTGSKRFLAAFDTALK